MPYVIDKATSLSILMDLLAIPGVSGREGAVVREIVGRLRSAGVPKDAIHTDNAHRRSPLRGEVGNLVCRLEGTVRAPRRMLMAHVDTVPLCEGARPVRRGGYIVPAARDTALGADNRGGAAVILNTLLHILKHRLHHPPLTFFWPVQEEVGLHGVEYAAMGLLGRPRLAFNFDGGRPEKLTVGATGAYRMEIEITGKASHAGMAPEEGVSAVAIAGCAIAILQRKGWHGKIQKKAGTGTSNIGAIEGGGATNVVTDSVRLSAEARSHDPVFRREIVAAFESAFTDAVDTVRSQSGARGKVSFQTRLDYESFALAADEPCVVEAAAAVRAASLTPAMVVCDGGLDANWITARGVPTVSLGAGQMNAHMLSERLHIKKFHQACGIALMLATRQQR